MNVHFTGPQMIQIKEQYRPFTRSEIRSKTLPAASLFIVGLALFGLGIWLPSITNNPASAVVYIGGLVGLILGFRWSMKLRNDVRKRNVYPKAIAFTKITHPRTGKVVRRVALKSDPLLDSELFCHANNDMLGADVTVQQDGVWLSQGLVTQIIIPLSDGDDQCVLMKSWEPPDSIMDDQKRRNLPIWHLTCDTSPQRRFMEIPHLLIGGLNHTHGAIRTTVWETIELIELWQQHPDGYQSSFFEGSWYTLITNMFQTHRELQSEFDDVREEKRVQALRFGSAEMLLRDALAALVQVEDQIHRTNRFISITEVRSLQLDLVNMIVELLATAEAHGLGTDLPGRTSLPRFHAELELGNKQGNDVRDEDATATTDDSTDPETPQTHEALSGQGT